MIIRLTPKQHAFLNLAADPHGINISPSAWRTRNYLSRNGLIEQTINGGWHYVATDKGRAVLDVIETGEVVMFNT